MRNSETFVDFGKSFEEKFALIFMDDYGFARDIMDAVNIESFTIDYVRTVIEASIAYYKKYTAPMGEGEQEILFHDLIAECRRPTDAEQLQTFWMDLPALRQSTNAPYVKDRAREFFRQQKVKSTILEIIQDAEQGDYSTMIQKISDAIRVGDSIELPPNYNNDLEDRYSDNYRQVVPTGWVDVDAVMNGGNGLGELALILAPPNIGKSMLAARIAAYAQLCNFNIIFFTLELGYRVVGRRFDSYFSGYPINDLPYHYQEVEEIVKQVPGQGLILEFPNGVPTLDSIRAATERVYRDRFDPHLVIIDYPELMQLTPLTKNAKRHEAIGDLYRDIRAYAREFNVAVWTPSQVTRAAYKTKIDNEHVAEAAAKIHVADFSLSFNYLYDDDGEPLAPEARVTKNRNGPRGKIFEVEYDPARVHIELTTSRRPDHVKRMQGNGRPKLEVQSSSRDRILGTKNHP